MLFPEEDAPQLKKWIVKRLENTSDADADVLADYVLALLRHDGDIESVRRLCEEEIPDFLQEDSSVFVSDVFDAIKYRSYIPGAPPPPRNSVPAAPVTAPRGPASSNFGISDIARGPQNGSRKRPYNESGGGDFQDHGDYQTGVDMNRRAFKQPKRGGNIGRGGRNDPFGNFRDDQQQQTPLNISGVPLPGFPNMSGMSNQSPGMPPIDPNNPMATFLAMQAMGFPGLPQLPQGMTPGGGAGSPASGFPQGQRSRRCRDYDTKGFCARGNSCKFEHGNDSIYVPPAQVDEYDPSNSMMTGVENSTSSIFPPTSHTGYNHVRGNDRARGRGQRGDRGSMNGTPRGRGGRAEFSSDRPNFDRTKTTIVIENIPEEKFSEESVQEFFSEFGTIEDVTMRPYKRLALVRYNDWNAAKAAYSSPKVIFDNRFVKVYWYTNDESLPQTPAASSSNILTAANNGNPVQAPSTAPESQIDMEEFARKQEEAQKAHEIKMKKKAEMEAKQKELEQRQEELLKRQGEEKRKLMERIAAKSAKSGSLTTPASELGGNPIGDAKAAQSDALKAQLAALKAEAESLGLDPAAVDDSSWGGRGRGARGRGGYRGRGTFVPRGYHGQDRGGYRGRGGASFGATGANAYNAYRLDNRPKKVALIGIDFTEADKEESLRQYLLGIGEFTDFEATPSSTSVTFKDRPTAEKFMYGGEIPSVGKVEMKWIQTPLPPVNLSKPVQVETTKLSTADELPMTTNADESDAMGGVHDSSSAGGRHVGQENQELDYDVADDNDWQ